jgi:hypothetical protein
LPYRLHSFPKDSDRRQQFAKAVNRKDFEPKVYSTVGHKNVPSIQVHTFFQNNTILKNKGIKTLPYILSLEKCTTYSAFLK